MTALTPNQQRARFRRTLHHSFLHTRHDPISVPNAPPVVHPVMQVFLILTGVLTLSYLFFGY